MAVQFGAEPRDFKPMPDVGVGTYEIRYRDSANGAFRGVYVAKFADAEVMKLRAEVMIRTAQRIKAQGLTQAEAARQLGITQPRVSRLIKGKVEDFSLDMLLTLATRAGLHAELRLSD